MSGELREHLENDLKAELTEAKIDKVIAVTPELQRFSEKAKVKWKPDPEATDLSQMANAIGGLNDYMAFFESQGTRLTEYWVDLMKIYDARAVIMLRKAQAEAREKLEAEKKALREKKESASPEEAEQIEKDLERAKLALERVDEAVTARDDARKRRSQYALSEEEIARVEARIEQINGVFSSAGYVKDGDEPS
jgi:DNA repair exonuclease SbcCD ATPase subunit